MDFQLLEADSQRGHPGSSTIRAALPAVVSEDGDPARQQRHHRSVLVQTDESCITAAVAAPPAAGTRTTGSSMSYFAPSRMVAVIGALIVAFVALLLGIAATVPSENK